MAGAKEIKNRIVSVKNTRKITKTMEMVSTAKSRRMMDRVNASKPYATKIAEIMGTLSGLKNQVESPLLRTVDEPKKVALLVITANRGLCGGYNSNVLKMARKRLEEYKEKGVEVELHVVGKKGISFFKFMKIAMTATHTNIDDSLKFTDAEALAEHFMHAFSSGKLDRVEAISTVYHSSASQKPEVVPLLPVGVPADSGEKKKGAAQPDVIYEPDPRVILKNILPHVVKTSFYRVLLEAVTAEQIYRRIAMKSATDAASEMVKLLNRTYNRIRQAGITQEIGEIVAGADAVG